MATKTTKTKTSEAKEKTSIMRQISGAVIGGSLALVAYYAYDYGSPVVTAWLLSTPSIANVQENDFAQTGLSKYDKRRVESQVRAIAKANGSNNQYSSVTSSLLEVVDTVWEEEWKEEEPLVIEEVEVDEPEVTEYLPEEFTDSVSQEEENFTDEMDSVPELPDSGFGVLAIMVAAGSAAGIRVQSAKRRVKNR